MDIEPDVWPQTKVINEIRSRENVVMTDTSSNVMFIVSMARISVKSGDISEYERFIKCLSGVFDDLTESDVKEAMKILTNR